MSDEFKQDDGFMPDIEKNNIDPTLDQIEPEKEELENASEPERLEETEAKGLPEEHPDSKDTQVDEIPSEIEKQEEQSEGSGQDSMQETQNDVSENNDDSGKDAGCVEPKRLDEIHQQMLTLETTVEKTLSEIREVHKLYHNEFAGRLGKMQKELDVYHEIDSKKVFDDILLDIARIYCDNEQILPGIVDEKNKKQVGYLFDDLEQLLDSYDVQIHRSKVGEKRDVRLCKIQRTIETDNPEMNDTVAESIKPGFYKGNHVLIKENIEVYVYKKSESPNQE